jgi:hypothetical protein
MAATMAAALLLTGPYATAHASHQAHPQHRRHYPGPAWELAHQEQQRLDDLAARPTAPAATTAAPPAPPAAANTALFYPLPDAKCAPGSGDRAGDAR